MGTSFSFKGVEIKSVAPIGSRIVINRVARPIMKPVTEHKVEIPGRAGSWDFGGGVARDFTIVVDLTIIGSGSGNVMECARAIETALAGKGNLIFDDDPSRAYAAQVYEEAIQRPVGSGHIARATIVFECDAEVSIEGPPS